MTAEAQVHGAPEGFQLITSPSPDDVTNLGGCGLAYVGHLVRRQLVIDRETASLHRGRSAGIHHRLHTRSRSHGRAGTAVEPAGQTQQAQQLPAQCLKASAAGTPAQSFRGWKQQLKCTRHGEWADSEWTLTTHVAVFAAAAAALKVVKTICEGRLQLVQLCQGCHNLLIAMLGGNVIAVDALQRRQPLSTVSKVACWPAAAPSQLCIAKCLASGGLSPLGYVTDMHDELLRSVDLVMLLTPAGFSKPTSVLAHWAAAAPWLALAVRPCSRHACTSCHSFCLL